jgi:hypothetical protein
MELKTKFIIIILILSKLSLFSQRDTISNINQDPLKPKIVSIDNNWNDFLIKQDTIYNVLINDIEKIMGGYIIRGCIMDSNPKIYITIVSEETKIQHNYKKIKIGENYLFVLNKYFELPSYGSMEYTWVNNILLGNKTLHIICDGSYNYLYCSLNLEGLYYIDLIKTYSINEQMIKEKKILENTIINFIEEICCSKEKIIIYDYVDTNLIIKSLKKYCDQSYKLSFKTWSNPNFKQPYKNKYRKWEIDNICTKDFNSFFFGMLNKDYKLPVHNCLDFKIQNITYKIVDYSTSGIYTLQVKWKINKSEFMAIVCIKEINQMYKIIGFNQRHYMNH